MAQQAAVPVPSARIVRWRPPVGAESVVPECRAVWRDNVVRRQDFEAAHPDVIWLRHEMDSPWAAYVPMPDDMFLDVTDNVELGGLLDKLETAVVQRDGQHRQAS